MVLAVAMSLFCAAAVAQVKVGDELSLSANGTVTGGYAGSYGTDAQSTHGFNFGGSSNIAGDYFSPNFLSFNINPYYNQSRNNSTSQSITSASGVSLSTNIFAGSHFPGSISYSDRYNSQGSFAVPGQGDLVTHGNSHALNIVWSERLPDAPSLTAGFTQGSSEYSVFGSDANGGSSFKNFYLNSQYRIDGFNLGGGYTQGSGNSLIPQVFTNGSPATATNNDRNFNFFASHLLPLGGGTSLSATRSYLDNDYLGYKFNGTIDNVNFNAGLNPVKKWNISFSGSYSDNLSGQLYEAIVPGAGADTGSTGSTTPPVTTIAPGLLNGESSHAWDMELNTSYAFGPNLIANGQAVRREQTFGNGSFGSDLFGGGALYSRPLLGGFISANGFVSDNKLDNGTNYLSFITNSSFNRSFGRWRTSVSGGYSQNAQSALISYTTSNYNLSGNIARKVGPFFWTGSAGTSRSALTAQPHTKYTSDSYSTGFGYKDLSLQGNYTRSDGNGLAGGAGLTQAPLPPIIPPSLLILYGGTSYGAALSGSPISKLTFSAIWTKSMSNTTTQGIFSANHFQEQALYVQYQFRKVGVAGGYTRIGQGFTASGLPANYSSYSIGVYRWFNFF
jgi:hypothetical protein